MGKRSKNNGSPHVLFTQLVVCNREGDIFYAGGQSKEYQRTGAMTAAYVRELVAKLTVLLAEYDAERGAPAPVLDGIHLSKAGEHISFELLADGQPVGQGLVTKEVGRKAKAFLDGLFDDPKIISFRKPLAKLLPIAMSLGPLLGVG